MKRSLSLYLGFLLFGFISSGSAFDPARDEILPSGLEDTVQNSTQNNPLHNTDEGNHWAYSPLNQPMIPDSALNGTPCENPIDAFLQRAQRKLNLPINGTADPVIFLRRLCLHLTGLPPTPRETEEFIKNYSPEVIVGKIDSLLASPRFGERWARHWLDAIGFSESQGFERDKIRKHAWKYRDYVIASFNADKPYSQFVREQIAGDLMEHPNSESIIATGFLTAGPWDEVSAGQANPIMREATREEELQNMVSIVGQVLLGTTINCARCHDHKYDPIPQKDYYRIKAALEGVHHGNRITLTGENRRRYETRNRELNASMQRIGREIKSLKDNPVNEQRIKELEGTRKGLSMEANALKEASLGYGAVIKKTGPTYLLARGNVQLKKEPVRAGGLSIIRNPDPDLGLAETAVDAERRKALAFWITNVQNPLFSRTIVNRIWYWHFGQGLVDTPHDLGRNSKPPSHPELLDWLANYLIHSNWSLKKLHRLILTSQAFSRSSEWNDEAAEFDSENQYLWRFNPRRMDAETVRDAMLKISGQINYRMGGAGYRPFDVTVNNTHFYTWTDHQGETFNRRTIYRVGVQSARDPLLDSLDCPDLSTMTPKRNVTTTPLQSLTLMNNPFVQRQTEHFADRLVRRYGIGSDKAIDFAYLSTLSRQPDKEEKKRIHHLIQEHGMASLTWILFNSSEFLYIQ